MGWSQVVGKDIVNKITSILNVQQDSSKGRMLGHTDTHLSCLSFPSLLLNPDPCTEFYQLRYTPSPYFSSVSLPLLIPSYHALRSAKKPREGQS